MLKTLDLVLGWGVFLVTSIVYLLTIEPTSSWWDCGEFIATAYKMQVTHPPGAPLFQMLGRVFSLFAMGDKANVAMMINVMSALSSALTVMFLFWTITLLARKIVGKESELNKGNVFAIIGAGLVGALAFTFTDSFWFSAVEGEVYAMSSFFTALVFWAILRWERVADQKHHLRWMVLIAYVIGLSIGVHLLNLLAIPAIAFVYYYKRYTPSWKGMIYTGIISVFLLFLIMNVIIPGVVKLIAKTELLFVNTFRMPFDSGSLFFFALLAALIVGGLYITYRRGLAFLNTAILALTFILIGYSSFFMIVIRANANPPQNMNNPNDAISMLSYLGREQYGAWPLFYGAYYNAPLDPEKPYLDSNPVYRRDLQKRRYVIADDRKESVPNFDSRFKTIFPRMWSNQKPSHINAYKAWGKVKGTPIQVTRPDGSQEILYKPSFIENLRFFFSYQVGHMYLRYFMWNFVGRQNDIEGHGSIEEGNWISGINFIDKTRVGSQNDLPPSMQNPANNKFYFLPLLLGLAGLFYQVRRNSKDAVVVGLLFLMTGLAIIVYLNQTPFQPRERDYSYAGSFYAYAIWIGLGVMALWSWLSKKISSLPAALIVTLVSLLLVPGIMAREGWDDHDRSHKYVARDFAYNYLISCDQDAVLLTYGDNDTFPLWYIQDVEDVRTDIRVANHMLASGDWYIQQLSRKVNKSKPLPFTLTNEQYGRGANDVVYFYDRNLPDYVELMDLVDFIASESDNTKVSFGGRKVNYFPTKKVKMTINRDALIKSGLVPQNMIDEIEPQLKWEIQQTYLYRNDMAMIDFLATSNFERPFFFTSPGGVDKVISLDEFMHLEGFSYKLMPVKAKHHVKGLGGINVDATYDVLVNKARWGNINDPRVTIDRESMRNSMFPRQNFMRLAQALLEENKLDSAKIVADKFREIFVNEKIPYDMYTMPFAEVYYESGETAKANEMIMTIVNNYLADIAWYDSQPAHIASYYQENRQQAVSILQRLSMMARLYDQTETKEKIDSSLKVIRGLN